MIKDVIGCVSSGSTGTYQTVRSRTGVVRLSFADIDVERGQKAEKTQTVRTPPLPVQTMPSWRERVCACDIARRAGWRALCGHAHAHTRWGRQA